MNLICNFIVKLSTKRTLSQTVTVRLLSTDTIENIEIPKRIQRGPTDILQALESTITRDYTAPHYKYHDDPYLIPTSNLGKRTYAMSQEAGRKAAHWVRKENADLFQHKEADPIIKLFSPKLTYNENSDVTVSDLNETIKNAYVSDAAFVYKLLRTKNTDVPRETLQGFLELLCFYNNDDPIPEEFIEERWFRHGVKEKERLRKTWKDGDLAEEIFITIDNPNAEAYTTIIRGMIKYGQVDRAWQLFEEAQTKNHILSVEAYNAIISAANYLKEGYELRWDFVVDILSMMAIAKIKPNLGTLNSILKTLSTMGTSRLVKQNALKTLAEFKALNIEPCLTSWYYILITFCKERGPINPVLRSILNELKGTKLKIQDQKDTFFFVTAMDNCANHLHDNDLARQVHELLNLHNNYDLIGDSYKESIYYRHFVTVLSQTEPLDKFMEEIYEKYVPHIYIPEPSVMLDILKCVELNDAVEYIPRLWSDIIIFDHASNEKLVNLVVNIMVNNKVTENKTLCESFATIAWTIWDKIENPPERKINKLSFTGDMLGKLITLLLRNDNFDRACIAMDKLQNDLHTIVGVPSFDVLKLYVEHCIQQKVPSRGISCVQYAVDNGFEDASSLANALNKSLTLDETHLRKLSELVGSDAIEKVQ
ncbi:hypothetical protein FQA39_LY05260 [Lamprigera yunnana]|nr:hypothetical protein FQA39_LY05260 [Lamprigera yunnana]